MNKKSDTNIHELDDETWREVSIRRKYIHYLYSLSYRTIKDIKNVAEKMNLGVAQVYNLLRKYTKNPTATTLLPQKRGWIKGKTRLSSSQITIIDEVVNDDLYEPERHKLSDIKVEIDRRCRLNNISRPSMKAISNQIALLDKKKVLRKREGFKKAHQKYDPVRKSLEVQRPLQMVQIDHTRVDLEITNNERLESIGRPWITLAIDVYTRMILAFYLSLHHPSAVSVAATMSQMLLPKDNWLKARGIEIDWPARGIPESLAMDNAKEFWSNALRRACGQYGIEPLYRLVGRPKVFGAHIERLVGTVMGAVHLLPGTTFSNIKEKGDYKSEDKATLTFEEAEHWIALEILGVYHQRKHTGINLSPITSWHNSLDKSIDTHLYSLNQRQLFIDFLPYVFRTVGREGIVFNKIHYWDDVLTTWLTRSNRKVFVKYNPRDLSQLFIIDTNGIIHPIGYRDLCRPPITLSELLFTNSALNELGIQSVDEDTIFNTILAQRELVTHAKSEKKLARRAAKKRELGFQESQNIVYDSHQELNKKTQEEQLIDDSEDDSDEDYTSEEWL